MQVLNTKNELISLLENLRKEGKKIGFVPTMGALHEGHLSLVKESKHNSDITVVSIFVNPTQFNDQEDLKRYPRTLDKDIELLKTVDCDIAFAPSVEEIYPEPDTRQFSYAPLDTVMEGAFRPGHFNGVCQIVSKLFDAVLPDRAYFGQKDAQQLAVIKRMVKDLNMPLTITGCPIIREEDGLAKSSRNTYLLPEERKAAYACDITYVTNNELGFDYLRDNMVIYKEQLVQRDLHYCIIDEVDSILIDEARTPLIISGQSGKSTKLYEACDILAQQLERGEASHEMTKMAAIMGEEVIETGDFVVNEKDKIVNLTEQGVHKVEKFFHIENLADPENLEIQHNITLALRAHNLMHKDQDYVVKDDEILIVDEFTGRIMPGRRYSDGLHQAIEAKEHVKIKRESKTLATITFQNFFNKYDKKGGMTGTAVTEEKEFRDIYAMDVVEIPTNRPVIRVDHEDAVYMTKKEKFNAVVNAVVEAHAKQQPVLVGTITIETSELLSRMLKRQGIKHNVLNAKFHELEAEIVSQAGQAGAVTIATNMAGRGTDIKLDDVARNAGGLMIIGTERHESRRIDNQLRGRSGRQGDPGESRFYISLEDDLMRLFGSERLMKIFTSLGVAENEQIEHKMLSNAIEKAQEKIEFNNFGIRKNLLDYDQVNNEQREIIYKERRQVLDGENMREAIYKMIQDTVDTYVDMCFSDDVDAVDWDLNEFSTTLLPIIPIEPAKEVRIVLAFFVFRLLKLSERAVRKDMEAFPMFLCCGSARLSFSGSKGSESDLILPSRSATILVAYFCASSGLCVTITTSLSSATFLSRSMT